MMEAPFISGLIHRNQQTEGQTLGVTRGQKSDEYRFVEEFDVIPVACGGIKWLRRVSSREGGPEGESGGRTTRA